MPPSPLSVSVSPGAIGLRTQFGSQEAPGAEGRLWQLWNVLPDLAAMRYWLPYAW